MVVIMSEFRKIYKKIPWFFRDRISFVKIFGRFPNIKKPKTFNEKVLYRKRNACFTDPVYSILADKYLVRDYVSNKIGDEYLIPLFDSFDSVGEIKLRIGKYSDFVLKPNHGAGMVKIIDKITCDIDVDQILKVAEEWMETDYAKMAGEVHYAKIKRKILVEKRIGEEKTFLVDYKIHLFKNNNNDFSFVLQIIDDRFVGELNRTFYLDDLNNAYSGGHKLDAEHVDKIKKALELSKVLIGDLEYARIDWYINDGAIYFGEITLTPAAGLGRGYGQELDLLMGAKWDMLLAPR